MPTFDRHRAAVRVKERHLLWVVLIPSQTEVWSCLTEPVSGALLLRQLLSQSAPDYSADTWRQHEKACAEGHGEPWSVMKVSIQMKKQRYSSQRTNALQGESFDVGSTPLFLIFGQFVASHEKPQCAFKWQAEMHKGHMTLTLRSVFVSHLQ